MKRFKNKAFTLAEVLITLTILGVVAAITVPSLQKQNYNRIQITRLAKAYSLLEKAAANVAVNSGCLGKTIECTGLLADNIDQKNLRKKIIELGKFERVSLDYSTNTVYDSYFHVKPLNYKKTKQDSAWTGTQYKYVLFSVDDIVYNVDKFNSLGIKGLKVTVFTDKSTLYDKQGKIMQYTNAVMGRNVFSFVIYDTFIVEPLTGGSSKLKQAPLSKLKKVGLPLSSIDGYCNPNSTSTGDWKGSGVSCTGRIVRDGWKMKY